MSSWRERALCAGQTDRWFSDDPQTTLEARLTCLTCPVRPECLHEAQTTEAREGVWAGLTEADRADWYPPVVPLHVHSRHGWRTGNGCEGCHEAYREYDRAAYRRRLARIGPEQMRFEWREACKTYRTQQ